MKITGRANQFFRKDLLRYGSELDWGDFGIEILIDETSSDEIMGFRLKREYSFEEHISVGGADFDVKNLGMRIERRNLRLLKALFFRPVMVLHGDVYVSDIELRSNKTFLDLSDDPECCNLACMLIMDQVANKKPSSTVIKNEYGGVVYKSIKDVPYNVEKYAVGHDGLTNVTDLEKSIKIYGDLAEELCFASDWYHNQFEGRNRSKSCYFSKDAEMHGLKTEVIVKVTDKRERIDTYIDGAGKEVEIHWHWPVKVLIRVQAGNANIMNLSEKLFSKKTFSLDQDIDIIRKYIKDENERILKNIDPDADNRRSSKQLTEAFLHREERNN